jgi:hypothetical protein
MNAMLGKIQNLLLVHELVHLGKRITLHFKRLT